MLRERSLPLPFDLWLIANVGEEGLGDLIGMKAVVDRLKKMCVRPWFWRVRRSDMSITAPGVRRYRITVQSPGGIPELIMGALPPSTS